MTAYNSAVGETVTEKIIEKSRFLTYVTHVESEEEAKAFLNRLHSLHPLATHICYGYVADKLGNLQRFSDDGEPQGTAGMPILNVIKAQGLKETAVAVVRYFGGIKLGAGGLTRAYASGASEGLAASEIRRYRLAVELSLYVDYKEVNALLRFLANYEVLSREFTAEAVFTVVLEEEEKEEFLLSVTDYLSGNVRFTEGEHYFYAFKQA